MSKEENERLKELEVTDPDQWEKTFQKIKGDIEETKKDIQELKGQF